MRRGGQDMRRTPGAYFFPVAIFYPEHKYNDNEYNLL